MKTKFLAVFLFLVMLLSMMSACGGGGAEEKGTSAVPDRSPLEGYEGEWLTIYEGGVTEFSVVRPEDNASDTLIAQAVKLRQYFTDDLGAGIAITTDFVRRGEEPPTDTKELLVGATNRAESVAAKKTIRYGDFIIKIEKNRAVILGGSDLMTGAAVDCFIKYFIKTTENENGLVIQIPANFEYRYEKDYDVEHVTVLGKELKDCVVISDKETKAYAGILAGGLAEVCGFLLTEVEVKRAEDTMTGFELVLEEDPENHLNYEIKVQGNRILVVAASELAMFNAVRDMVTGLIPAAESVVIDAEALASLEKAPADVNEIYTVGNTLVINNRRVTIVVGDDGVVDKFIEKVSRGDDILRTTRISSFCYLLKNYGETEIYPSSMEYVGDGLVNVKFADGLILRFKVEVFDNYSTFELLNELPTEYYSICFADFKVDYEYDYEVENPVTVFGYSMNVNTSHQFYPNGDAKSAGGISYSELGTKGAKLAVITCPDEEQRDIMKEVNTQIEDGVGLVLSTGGAYAKDHPENKGDWLIQSEGIVSNLQQWIDLYTAMGVDQVCFHHQESGANFRQGDFYFHETEGSVTEFKKQVVDPLNEAGILAGMHTYSFYISYNADEILSDTKWQQQLNVKERFTLAEDISATSTTITTLESTAHLPQDWGFMTRSSPFILIDQELIQIVPSAQGFVQVVRGCGGTTPAEHKAGAEIRHLDGNYNLLVPEIGSELFYEIARRIAKTYNEGGFGMIMFDAINGIEFHLDDKNYIGMYYAAFINEVLKHTETDPLISVAGFTPEIWAIRGRYGDLDSPSREYNYWNDWRIHEATIFSDRHLATTMSWYDFWPEDKFGYRNYLYDYHYVSNVDYLGTLAIAYDASIVYNNPSPSKFLSTPGLLRNVQRYTQYSDLRESGYFSEEVKEMLRKSKYEFTLTQKGDVWGFTEVEYFNEKFRDTSIDNTLSASNDFEEQTPFVRIENLYSTNGKNAITLMDFDENQELKMQVLSRSLNGVNISNNLAIKVRVYGNNSDDMLCISLRGSDTNERGYADYVIRLDFEGWRDIIITQANSGEYISDDALGSTFKDWSHNAYELFRSPVNFASLTDITVYTSGECAGVRVDTIEALQHVNQPLVNPVVKIGDTVLKIQGSINACEYLEYLPGEGAKVYNSVGSARDVTVVEQTLKVPSGDFEAVFESATSGAGPVNANLTIGVYGDFISN